MIEKVKNEEMCFALACLSIQEYIKIKKTGRIHPRTHAEMLKSLQNKGQEREISNGLVSILRVRLFTNCFHICKSVIGKRPISLNKTWIRQHRKVHSFILLCCLYIHRHERNLKPWRANLFLKHSFISYVAYSYDDQITFALMFLCLMFGQGTVNAKHIK